MLQMHTDSFSFFDIMTKATVPSEKRLMIDLACVKDAYNTEETDNISFTRSEYNAADALSRHRNVTILNDNVKKSWIRYPVEQ